MSKATFRSEGSVEGRTWYVEITTTDDNQIEMSTGFTDAARRASVTRFAPDGALSFAKALESLAIAAEAQSAD